MIKQIKQVLKSRKEWLLHKKKKSGNRNSYNVVSVWKLLIENMR